jgi:sporulation protein YlmC with PRC-barrel domain
MAGAGVRLFTAGSQLLASQINDYLMDQVVAYFTDSAARDAAFGGVGEPSLSPGKICYLFSDNKLYLYGNDNAWTEIGAQIDDLEVTTGKLADGAVTSTKILDGTIVNADINASAAIALTKLATGTIGTVVLHNASGVPTATALSGDVTVNSSGVTAIGSGVIMDADINASAAIDKTKISGTAVTLADTGTITSTMIANDSIIDADIKSNAAIAYSKLSLGTSIVNADVSTSAAIAHTKLANATAGQVLLGTTTTGVVTATTVTGDVTITGAGVTAIGSGVVVNADISTTAAIELGKLADATIDIKTGNYTLQLTDKNKFIKMNVTSTANTVTVPLDSTVTFPEGAQIHIIQYGTGKTQIVGASGSVILYSTPGAYLRAQYSSATLLKCAAANTWMLMGDLSAS